MELTLQQKQKIKEWLLLNATQMNDQEAAAALNAVRSPTYLVYRTFVPIVEIMGNGWNWARVDNMSIGKARIWDWMKDTYSKEGVQGLNFAKAECRSGVNAAWVGTQADLDVRDSVYVHSYKPASVLEHMFSTGAGTAPVNDGDGSGPGTVDSNIDSPATADDVVNAYNS